MDSPSRQPHASKESSGLPVPKLSASTPSSSSAHGSKRPAPSLLPAFEPLSSSPGLPRPLKRQNTGSDSRHQLLQLQQGFTVTGRGAVSARSHDARLKYPTPVPTSSTGLLSSSPPAPAGQRPSLRRTASERAPLSSVPAVELSENGETLMMGRSSNSSHYQLSANRLVSRVHVKARYIAATAPLEPSKLEIVCNGWNGLRLHCQGRTWELFKGDSFTSETEGTEIILDVQDARVMVKWPRKASDALTSLSDSSWDDSPRSQINGPSAPASSPLRRSMHLASPESPTPAHQLASSRRLQALLPEGDEPDKHGIKIYEDEPELPRVESSSVDVNASMRTEVTASFSSDLSDPEDADDPNEENDPIVHSFGPFGANLEGRLASISTNSPKLPRPHKAVREATSPSQERLSAGSQPVPKLLAAPKTEPKANAMPPPDHEPKRPSSPHQKVAEPITNHVINQLAFSRLSSTPLSTIMHNLPAEERQGLVKDALRSSMEAIPCIGSIERQGKDAAGKPLESEYYYVPERDEDEQRRAAVVDGLRRPSLRACRKQHKQYYWKRPKTP